jgi:hypothetical protein
VWLDSVVVRHLHLALKTRVQTGSLQSRPNSSGQAICLPVLSWLVWAMGMNSRLSSRLCVCEGKNTTAAQHWPRCRHEGKSSTSLINRDDHRATLLQERTTFSMETVKAIIS